MENKQQEPPGFKRLISAHDILQSPKHQDNTNNIDHNNIIDHNNDHNNNMGNKQGQPNTITRTNSVLRDPKDNPLINPFINSTPIGAYEFTKMLLFTLLLIPILRFILIFLLFLLCYIVAFCATAGHDPELPLPRCRRVFTWLMRRLLRTILFVAGYYWIPRRGKRDPSVRIIVANHVSFGDGVVVCDGGSVAAKTELFGVPIIGRMLRCLEAVRIDRESERGRADSIKRISGFVTNTQTPPLVVFAEGTTHIPKVLITFKRGAFVPALPIQPAVLRQRYYHFDQAYTPDLSDLFYYYRLFCQVYNWIEVEYLPVYQPSESEKADPMLYGANVRKIFAEKLHVPTTSHTFDDVRLMLEAAQARVGQLDVLAADLQHLLNVQFEHIRSLVREFHQLDRNEDGTLSFEEFSTLLERLAKTDAHWQQFASDEQRRRAIFDLLDTNHSHSIDFLELIVGVALFNGNLSPAQIMHVVFRAVDHNQDNAIDKPEFLFLLKTMEPNTGRTPEAEKQREALIAELFPTETSQLTMDQFAQAVEHHPELPKYLLAFANQGLHISVDA